MQGGMQRETHLLSHGVVGDLACDGRVCLRKAEGGTGSRDTIRTIVHGNANANGKPARLGNISTELVPFTCFSISSIWDGLDSIDRSSVCTLRIEAFEFFFIQTFKHISVCMNANASFFSMHSPAPQWYFLACPCRILLHPGPWNPASPVCLCVLCDCALYAVACNVYYYSFCRKKGIQNQAELYATKKFQEYVLHHK